jgi:hypothetical protein
MNAWVTLIEFNRNIGDRVGFDLLNTLGLIEGLERAWDVNLNAQVTLPIETE